MKTNVRLGILHILVEAEDEQELIRKAWAIYRLNEAATQEGLSIDEVMPFAETGTDDNEYAGFIVLTDPGKRINFGHTKAGKRWYPRTKGSEYYKGVVTFREMDTTHQLAEHNDRPQIGGQAAQRPNHDEPRHGSPAGEDMSPGEILTNMRNELEELRDDGAALGNALARYARCWERMPDGPAKTAHTMWQKYEGIRKSLETAAA